MGMRVAVSIDPGTVTSGIVIWSMKKWDDESPAWPLDAAAYTIGGTAYRRNYIGGVRELISRVRNRLRGYTVDRFYVEEMQTFGSVRGGAAAQDVLRVSFACGAYFALAEELGAAFHAVPVSEWKGNLPKSIVHTRILKRYGFTEHDTEEETTLGGLLSNPISHDWDAMGIGLFAQGKF